MLAAMELGRIRGAAVREFFIWFEGRYGSSAFDRLLSRVPLERAVHFRKVTRARSIAPDDWFPAEAIHSLCDALGEGRSGEELDLLLLEGTETMMTANLGATFRRFVMRHIITPNLYLKHSQRLWNLYFDNGKLEVTPRGPTELHWRVRGWASHHRVLCRMVTYSETSVFGAMGCLEVQSEPLACVSEGADHCSHTIRWKGG